MRLRSAARRACLPMRSASPTTSTASTTSTVSSRASSRRSGSASVARRRPSSRAASISWASRHLKGCEAVSGRPAPERNIALELVRVTEAGAMAAARWIGRGEKESADGAAVDAMRVVLDTVRMRGVVVIGEGEKDDAPMLYNGEEVGSGEGPEVDVAVDPLEGTRLTALGQPNAICVIAVAERGTMLFPGAAVYMEKIAVGPAAIDAIDITRSPADNVRAVAEALDKSPRAVDVVVLERERHDTLIAELRGAGARVRLIRDGDVAPSIAAAQPGTGVDMLYGIGGTPEGVISAAALKCVGGGIQGRLWPRNEVPRRQRWSLQCAPVRERQLPRMRAAPVHRVQVRGRVLVRLAAGEEHDARHRGGNVLVVRVQAHLGDLVHARALRRLVAGEDHVRLEQRPGHVDLLIEELRVQRGKHA